MKPTLKALLSPLSVAETLLLFEGKEVETASLDSADMARAELGRALVASVIAFCSEAHDGDLLIDGSACAFRRGNGDASGSPVRSPLEHAERALARSLRVEVRRIERYALFPALLSRDAFRALQEPCTVTAAVVRRGCSRSVRGPCLHVQLEGRIQVHRATPHQEGGFKVSQGTLLVVPRGRTLRLDALSEGVDVQLHWPGASWADLVTEMLRGASDLDPSLRARFQHTRAESQREALDSFDLAGGAVRRVRGRDFALASSLPCTESLSGTIDLADASAFVACAPWSVPRVVRSSDHCVLQAGTSLLRLPLELEGALVRLCKGEPVTVSELSGVGGDRGVVAKAILQTYAFQVMPREAGA